jgi:hypothetical protein
MNINEAFPNRYLKAADLNGRDVIVTIKSTSLEEIGFDKERKLVLAFAGTEKSMVLNKTNANTIARIFGEETDDWAGKRITLCARDVEYQGMMMSALRVLPQKPAAALKAAPPPPAVPVAPAATQETADEIEDDDLPF